MAAITYNWIGSVDDANSMGALLCGSYWLYLTVVRH